MWNNYKKFTTFPTIFAMTILLMGIFVMQLSILKFIESEKTVWEGLCSDIEVSVATDTKIEINHNAGHGETGRGHYSPGEENSARAFYGNYYDKMFPKL